MLQRLLFRRSLRPMLRMIRPAPLIMASSRVFSAKSDPGNSWRFRPRDFPLSGFEQIDPKERVEEEKLPDYKREEYYPMNIGDIINDCYQVVAKLGYGTSSTVWLARDLRDGKYWALKVHINTMEHNQELQVYRHLADVDARDEASKEEEKRANHPGRKHVRQLNDVFTLQGPHGEHVVFVMTPLGMSLHSLQNKQQHSVFQPILVTQAIMQVLLGLDFLHRANVIHTDLHAANLLIAMTSDKVLPTLEENEVQRPSARKIDPDTRMTTYVSQYVLGGVGPLTLCDLGQARIGGEQTGPAMPTPYRSPEVILGIPWGKSVDTWAMALLAWDLLEPESLFRVYDEHSPARNDALHLAAMTAVLGPPPPAFLARSSVTKKYWDEKGQWHGPVPLPPRRTLASLVTTLTGDDKDKFVDFLDNFLWWIPEERPDALQAYFHPWLRDTKP